jgi:hypothetical protein
MKRSRIWTGSRSFVPDAGLVIDAGRDEGRTAVRKRRIDQRLEIFLVGGRCAFGGPDVWASAT